MNQGRCIELDTRAYVLCVLEEVLGFDPSVGEHAIKAWHVVGALFSLMWEKPLQSHSLKLIKTLMVIRVSDTDAGLAKQVLYTRYV